MVYDAPPISNSGLNRCGTATESNMKIQNQTTRSKVRLSVSVPSMDYSELEIIASRQKVSVAWVIRDAIDNYLKSRENVASNRVSNTKKKK
jgi:predicted DNA-binding ribbon-helix-helix protein